MWGNRNKSDVYVAARVLARDMKFSLHESGDWRHQWVGEMDKRIGNAGNKRGRVIDSWNRPPEPPHGWTRGLSIWVPLEDVVDAPEDRQREEGVAWVALPDDGSAVVFHILIASSLRAMAEFRDAVVIGGFTLANGEAAIVFAALGHQSQMEREWLTEQRKLIRQSISGMDNGNGGVPRALVFDSDQDGHRVVWDIAV